MLPVSVFFAALLALAPYPAVGDDQKLLFRGFSRQAQEALTAPPSAPSSAAPLIAQSTSSAAPSYRDELLDLHKSLCSIESISGNEGKVGRFLAGYLEKKGYSVHKQNVLPRPGSSNDTERFNLLAWLGGGSRSKARVVVTSHIDVVPPYIPYHMHSVEGSINKDTIITGRGTADAKGSVAPMVVAMQQLLEKQAIARDDAMLLFVVGEEVGGEGMRTFSESLGNATLDSVIFGEPTENKLVCGHKGVLFCEATAIGLAGHSGYPWVGKSANEVMVHAMTKLLETDLGSSEKYGNTTVNIGRFSGGVSANVIPDHAVVGLATRVAAGNQKNGGEEVRRKVEAIFDEVDSDALSLKCTQSYGPVDCKCDVPGFETTVVNYGTDVPILKGNHTRYLYGPGSILVAHGPRENVTVGDLETAVEGYKKLILHALKK